MGNAWVNPFHPQNPYKIKFPSPLPPSDEGGGFCKAKDGGREFLFPDSLRFSGETTKNPLCKQMHYLPNGFISSHNPAK